MQARPFHYHGIVAWYNEPSQTNRPCAARTLANFTLQLAHHEVAQVVCAFDPH